MPTDLLEALEALVVDDDPAIRELLEEFLRSRRLTVTCASDGRAAVTALERSQGRFGLVLTDIAMPGADGFAVLRAARASNPGAYVVIITGFASIDTTIQAVRLGANDYLTKPFTFGQIEVVLQHAAERLASANASNGIGATAAAMDALDRRLAAIERSLADIKEILAHAPPRSSS